MVKPDAIVITGGLLDTNSAKTAHGLIRGTDRFTIVGIIDPKHPGRDAGEILDGIHRGIPVFASLEAYVNTTPKKASHCIIGVATKGGVIPDTLRVELKQALELDFNLVNGLHEYISDIS